MSVPVVIIDAMQSIKRKTNITNIKTGEKTMRIATREEWKELRCFVLYVISAAVLLAVILLFWPASY